MTGVQTQQQTQGHAQHHQDHPQTQTSGSIPPPPPPAATPNTTGDISPKPTDGGIPCNTDSPPNSVTNDMITTPSPTSPTKLRQTTRATPPPTPPPRLPTSSPPSSPPSSSSSSLSTSSVSSEKIKQIRSQMSQVYGGSSCFDVWTAFYALRCYFIAVNRDLICQEMRSRCTPILQSLAFKRKLPLLHAFGP